MPEGGMLRFARRALRRAARAMRRRADDRGSADRLRRHLDQRQRRRHAGRGQGACLRAVLHHQGGRPRHRARPQHGVRLRQAVAAARSTIDSAPGRRHDGDALHPARRRAGRPSRRRAPTPAGQRVAGGPEGAAGRGRRRGAQPSCDAFPAAAGLRGRRRAPAPSRPAGARRADAPFDVLLTDIALGAGMRGTELAAQAQQAPARHWRCC